MPSPLDGFDVNCDPNNRFEVVRRNVEFKFNIKLDTFLTYSNLYLLLDTAGMVLGLSNDELWNFWVFLPQKRGKWFMHTVGLFTLGYLEDSVIYPVVYSLASDGLPHKFYYTYPIIPVIGTINFAEPQKTNMDLFYSRLRGFLFYNISTRKFLNKYELNKIKHINQLNYIKSLKFDKYSIPYLRKYIRGFLNENAYKSFKSLFKSRLTSRQIGDGNIDLKTLYKILLSAPFSCSSILALYMGILRKILYNKRGIK